MPEARADARQKALKIRFELDYWRAKIGAFRKTAEEIDGGFSNRQLVDTGVMPRSFFYISVLSGLEKALKRCYSPKNVKKSPDC